MLRGRGKPRLTCKVVSSPLACNILGSKAVLYFVAPRLHPWLGAAASFRVSQRQRCCWEFNLYIVSYVLWMLNSARCLSFSMKLNQFLGMVSFRNIHSIVNNGDEALCYCKQGKQSLISLTSRILKVLLILLKIKWLAKQPLNCFTCDYFIFRLSRWYSVKKFIPIEWW